MSGHAYGTGSGELTAIAYCVRMKRPVISEVASSPAPVSANAATTTADPTCPKGKRLISRRVQPRTGRTDGLYGGAGRSTRTAPGRRPAYGFFGAVPAAHRLRLLPAGEVAGGSALDLVITPAANCAGDVGGAGRGSAARVGRLQGGHGARRSRWGCLRVRGRPRLRVAAAEGVPGSSCLPGAGGICRLSRAWTEDFDQFTLRLERLIDAGLAPCGPGPCPPSIGLMLEA